MSYIEAIKDTKARELYVSSLTKIKQKFESMLSNLKKLEAEAAPPSLNPSYQNVLGGLEKIINEIFPEPDILEKVPKLRSEFENFTEDVVVKISESYMKELSKQFEQYYEWMGFFEVYILQRELGLEHKSYYY
jgi:hypothetical protein